MAIDNAWGTPRLTGAVLSFSLLLCPRLMVAQGGYVCANPDTVTPPGLVVSVSLNGSVTRAVRDAATLGGSATFTHNLNPRACGPSRQRTLLDLRPSYDEKKDKGKPATITRSHAALLQRLVYLPGNQSYIAGTGRALHNNAIGIDLQQTYTLVIGREFVGRHWDGEFSAGPGFVGQNFLGEQESAGYWGIALGESTGFSSDTLTGGVQIEQNVRVILSPSSGYRWTGFGSVRLSVPVTEALKIDVTASDEYLSNPPSGFDRSYFKTEFGFTLSLQ